MLTDRSYKVGCSVCQFEFLRKGAVWNATEIACNYASTNVKNANVWKIGETGTLCEKGRHATYGSLCSVNESSVFDWNEVTVGV